VSSSGRVACWLLCLGGSPRESSDSSQSATGDAYPRDPRGVAEDLRQPRVHATLQAQSQRIGEHRVAWLMRTSAIRAKTVKRWRATRIRRIRIRSCRTRSIVSLRWRTPIRCGQVTSYVGTAEGWLYLAVVLDLYSRRVIAWGIGNRLTQELATAALTMVVEHRRPTSGVLHHTDRGAQYAAALYRELLAGYGLTASMSRRGNCWDNAVVESFFHTLKTELLSHRRYLTREEARQDMFEWIKVFYNRTHRHSTLGYRSPAEFEAMAIGS
jgi:putative transposase